MILGAYRIRCIETSRQGKFVEAEVVRSTSRRVLDASVVWGKHEQKTE